MERVSKRKIKIKISQPIERYLLEMPLLFEADEKLARKYWRQFIQGKDNTNEIVNLYLKSLMDCVNKYSFINVDAGELIRHGKIGILKAFVHYDGSSSLNSEVEWSIELNIIKYITDCGMTIL